MRILGVARRFNGDSPDSQVRKKLAKVGFQDPDDDDDKDSELDEIEEERRRAKYNAEAIVSPPPRGRRRRNVAAPRNSSKSRGRSPADRRTLSPFKKGENDRSGGRDRSSSLNKSSSKKSSARKLSSSSHKASPHKKSSSSSKHVSRQPSSGKSPSKRRTSSKEKPSSEQKRSSSKVATRASTPHKHKSGKSRSRKSKSPSRRPRSPLKNLMRSISPKKKKKSTEKPPSSSSSLDKKTSSSKSKSKNKSTGKMLVDNVPTALGYHSDDSVQGSGPPALKQTKTDSKSRYSIESDRDENLLDGEEDYDDRYGKKRLVDDEGENNNGKDDRYSKKKYESPGIERLWSEDSVPSLWQQWEGNKDNRDQMYDSVVESTSYWYADEDPDLEDVDPIYEVPSPRTQEGSVEKSSSKRTKKKKKAKERPQKKKDVLYKDIPKKEGSSEMDLAAIPTIVSFASDPSEAGGAGKGKSSSKKKANELNQIASDKQKQPATKTTESGGDKILVSKKKKERSLSPAKVRKKEDVVKPPPTKVEKPAEPSFFSTLFGFGLSSKPPEPSKESQEKAAAEDSKEKQPDDLIERQRSKLSFAIDHERSRVSEASRDAIEEQRSKAGTELKSFRTQSTDLSDRLHPEERNLMYTKSLITDDSDPAEEPPSTAKLAVQRARSKMSASIKAIETTPTELDEYSVTRNPDEPALVQCLRFYYCGAAANATNATIEATECKETNQGDEYREILDDLQDDILAERSDFGRKASTVSSVEIILDDKIMMERSRPAEAPDFNFLSRAPSFVLEVTRKQLQLDENSEDNRLADAMRRAHEAAAREEVSITSIEIPNVDTEESEDATSHVEEETTTAPSTEEKKGWFGRAKKNGKKGLFARFRKQLQQQGTDGGNTTVVTTAE